MGLVSEYPNGPIRGRVSALAARCRQQRTPNGISKASNTALKAAMRLNHAQRASLAARISVPLLGGRPMTKFGGTTQITDDGLRCRVSVQTEEGEDHSIEFEQSKYLI